VLLLLLCIVAHRYLIEKYLGSFFVVLSVVKVLKKREREKRKKVKNEEEEGKHIATRQLTF
jgi:hypothetical protein